MGVAADIIVVIGQMQIAGYEPGGNSARAERRYHQHGEVTTTSASEIKSPQRSLNPFLVPRRVPEGPPDGPCHIAEQLVRVGDGWRGGVPDRRLAGPRGRLERAHRSTCDLADRGQAAGALDEANYCIWCHEQDKDSCSKGLKEKPAAEDDRVVFKKSAFGVPLAGCPLEERISEFHKLKTEGWAIGALAMIVVAFATLSAKWPR